jgi:effector-binding domain-containing protein
MYEVTTRHFDDQPTLAMTGRVEADGIPGFLGRAYASIAAHIEAIGAGYAGPPYARYTPLGPEMGEFDVEAGFPVVGEAPGEGQIVASMLPGGEAAVVVHIGPYDQMMPAYQALTDWMGEHDSVADGPAWEVYLSDPEQQPDPSNWRTEIIQPYRVAAVV